jgi:lipoprotein-anchoring transpeptidase ErfK/SrfK
VVAPGKSNPLGSRWMGLSAKGYGIHGTNVPTSIGKAASHGCIRMRKQDLEELFEMVTVGTIVELVDEPTEVSE